MGYDPSNHMQYVNLIQIVNELLGRFRVTNSFASSRKAILPVEATKIENILTSMADIQKARLKN